MRVPQQQPCPKNHYKTFQTRKQDFSKLPGTLPADVKWTVAVAVFGAGLLPKESRRAPGWRPVAEVWPVERRCLSGQNWEYDVKMMCFWQSALIIPDHYSDMPLQCQTYCVSRCVWRSWLLMVLLYGHSFRLQVSVSFLDTQTRAIYIGNLRTHQQQKEWPQEWRNRKHWLSGYCFHTKSHNENPNTAICSKNTSTNRQLVWVCPIAYKNVPGSQLAMLWAPKAWDAQPVPSCRHLQSERMDGALSPEH